MAKKEAAAAIVTAEPKIETAKKETLTELQRSVYTADEFAARSTDFGTTADMVKTALSLAGVKSCTHAEAMKIVKTFLKS